MRRFWAWLKYWQPTIQLATLLIMVATLVVLVKTAQVRQSIKDMQTEYRRPYYPTVTLLTHARYADGSLAECQISGERDLSCGPYDPTPTP